MQDGTPPHLALSIRAWLGFKTILVVGGLGVKVKHGRREILILFSVISFWGFGPEKRPVIEKQEHAMNWNKKFYAFLQLSDCTS